MDTLRIGTLGAARITPNALLRPARDVDGVEVVAVAARDPERARGFASRHGIARVHDGYEALLDDAEIDAVYIPLPNSAHARLTLAALEAGKHVLVEKPFAANAPEARRVADAAAATDRVVMEAFHWRYHPLAARMLEIIESGELGAIEHVETRNCVPLPIPGDIRYRLDLAGGALMDVGCYSVHILRTLAGVGDDPGQAPEVRRARAWLSSPGVDRAMQADLQFADGRTGRIECSLFSAKLLSIGASVRGERGTLRVVNPMVPQLFHRLVIETASGKRKEQAERTPTYEHQLRAFRDAVREHEPFPTGLANAIANMAVIDDVYRAAGLEPRRGETDPAEPASGGGAG